EIKNENQALKNKLALAEELLGVKGATGEVDGTPGGAVKCVDIGKNTKEAKAVNYSGPDIEARKRGEQNGLDTRVVHAVNDDTLARVKLKGIDGDSHKHWSMWFNPMQRVEPYQGLTCLAKLWKHSGGYPNTGAAWPSSVRAVRRKERMTSGRHGPYALGDTRATMSELLVIANQPCGGEYVLESCTHRPSSHESRRNKVSVREFADGFFIIKLSWFCLVLKDDKNVVKSGKSGQETKNQELNRKQTKNFPACPIF
ncbi:26814_t:CDS:2, partial [Racocetra persica]